MTACIGWVGHRIGNTCRPCDLREAWEEGEGAVLQDAYEQFLAALGAEYEVAALEAVEAAHTPPTSAPINGYECNGSSRCTVVVDEPGDYCLGCERDMADARSEHEAQRY